MLTDKEQLILEKIRKKWTHIPRDEKLKRIEMLSEQIWEKTLEEQELLLSILEDPDVVEFARSQFVVQEEQIFAAYSEGPGNRCLHMVLPLRLNRLREFRSISMLNKKKRSDLIITTRIKWEGVVACAIKKALSSLSGSTERLKPFEKALVEITIYEKPNYVRDVDNFSITYIHNALVRNGVLADDDFCRLKYLVGGEYLSSRDEDEKTAISVYEIT